MLKSGFTKYLLLSILLSNMNHVIAQVQKYAPKAGIVTYDKRLNNLISANELPELLANGFTWSEGPVWVKELDQLLFSDVPKNTIYSWDERLGIQVYLSPSGHSLSEKISDQLKEPGSNGLVIDSEDNLIACQHGARQIGKMKTSIKEPKADFEVLAGSYNGKQFNSPNDLCMAKDGSIYFTDPPYGLQSEGLAPEKKLDFQGVFRLMPDVTLHLLDSTLTRPNGIALSPDERTLIVANSDPEDSKWIEYTLDENGVVVERSMFYQVKEPGAHLAGLPDGLKWYDDDYLFATGPGGVWVFTKDAVVIGRIQTGTAVANLAFDHKKNYLYLCSHHKLMRLKLR
jgi:gluconolactonase